MPSDAHLTSPQFTFNKPGGLLDEIRQAEGVLEREGDDDYTIFKGRTKSGSDAVVGDNPIEQEEQIAQYVEDTLSRNPKIQAILIKAEGDVKTGAVETVKRGVAGSELGLTRRLYVAVETAQ